MDKKTRWSARLEKLQKRIRYTFQNPDWLAEALTHSSFVNECPTSKVPDNQRLEFLGDAVLDTVVGEWLFRRYPDAREGELTRIRAYIVRTEGLAAFAEEISLGGSLRFGRGEAASGGHERSANLCAGFEALVGAMYLDQGLGPVRDWVNDLLEQHAGEIDAQRMSKDAKSRLQEYAQARLHVTPSYRIVKEGGPDHARVFTAQVQVAGELWGEGSGSSKQAAEQEAAERALEVFFAPHMEDSQAQ